MSEASSNALNQQHEEAAIAAASRVNGVGAIDTTEAELNLMMLNIDPGDAISIIVHEEEMLSAREEAEVFALALSLDGDPLTVTGCYKLQISRVRTALMNRHSQILALLGFLSVVGVESAALRVL
jgi:hypothetical protein